ncbi:39S ribosomal protein L55, mitochondrial [Intoshia linei]|uniref:39S ribosomal protein L55, mitochondrial n=1 Tax=Intoshia linei TaxID=1819745 RepID=A0A177AYT9_9BILA|nr:39S ribosomal protein L55, mitochondrial [Intoshia linei]
MNKVKHFFKTVQPNCNMFKLTTIKRKNYIRMYPVNFIFNDGSSITVRHKEPRKIIKLPLDLRKFTPEQMAAFKQKRKPTNKMKISKKENDEYFNNDQYSFLWK